MRWLSNLVMGASLLAISLGAQAHLTTVQDLKNLIAQGDGGEAAATLYVEGVVDGMLGMDSLRHKERNAALDFCGVYDAARAGHPIRHPAFRTKELVALWERNGHPMNTLAVDFVLAYMTKQYECKKK